MLDDMEYLFGIYVEVVVCYKVAHTFDCAPRYCRLVNEQFALCAFVQFGDGFPNSYQLHTDCIEFFHP